MNILNGSAIHQASDELKGGLVRKIPDDDRADLGSFWRLVK